MELCPLSPDSAEEISQLASRHHPPNLSLTPREIERSLQLSRRRGENFSVGLRDPEDQLVAYILAYLRPSRVVGRQETVVLVDDSCSDIAPGPTLACLLGHMVESLEEWGHHHLAIETVVHPAGLDLVLSQEEAIAGLGYELVGQHHYYDEDLNQQFTWLRFQRPWESEPESDSELEAVAEAEAWQGSEDCF